MAGTLTAAIIVAGVLVQTGGDLTAVATPPEERIDEQQTEQLVFEELNDRRTERRAALSYNDRAAAAAAAHAEHMARNDYFGHTKPSGETQQERYAFCSGGENIAETRAFASFRANYGESVTHRNESQIATGVVRQWMTSDPHRENGIYGPWSSGGAGIAVDGNRVVAVFGFCYD